MPSSSLRFWILVNGTLEPLLSNLSMQATLTIRGHKIWSRDIIFVSVPSTEVTRDQAQF